MNMTFESEEHFTKPHNKSKTTEEKAQLAQQHTLEKGSKKHEKRGKHTAPKEIGQLHNGARFEPM